MTSADIDPSGTPIVGRTLGMAPAAAILPQDTQALTVKVVVVAISILALLWGVLVLNVFEDRKSAFARAEESADRSARLLDAYANLLIGQADKVLVRSKALIETYLAVQGRSSLNDPADRPIWLDPLIAESLANVPDDSVIAIRDADGRLVASSTYSGRLMPGAMILEDTLLRRLTAENEPPPVLGYVVNLLGSGHPMLPIARHLKAPDGSFAGALIIGLSVRTLNHLYLATELGAQGAIELRGRKDKLLYRYTAAERDGGPGRSDGSGAFSPATHMRVSALETETPLRTVLVLSKDDILGTLAGGLRGMLAAGFGISVAVITMAVIIWRFLTTRYAADRRRLRAERKLLDAIDATSDVYVELDADLRVSEVSVRVERMTGLTPSDLIGLSIDSIRGEPADTEGAKSFRRAVVARRPFRDVVAPISLPGGHNFWVRGSGKPMFDEQGAFQGYRCMISDVTDHEVRKAAEIHQDRLMSLGQLAGGIAHDFNNLLAAILGFATLLEEDLKSDPPKRKLLERVIMSTNRAKELVQHILSFARVGSSTAEDVDVSAAVEEVLPLLRSSLPSSTRIDFENSVAGDLVHIDRARLAQVMVNLCTNANDALGERDGAIRIRLAPADTFDLVYQLLATSKTKTPDRFAVMLNHEGADRALVGQIDTSMSYVLLSVSDNGVGIDRGDLARMFEPYFTTKPVSKGGGLGLSVVHGIVLAANGAIAVTTSRGKGTVVDVFLPVAVRGPAIEDEAADARSRSTFTVMVVDDQREVREMIAMSLERRGMAVLECADGIKALQAFKADPTAWDAIVTDQSMPGLRGLDLIRELKTLRPDVPCILCSGLGDATCEKSAMAAGADVVMQKPVMPDTLQETVSRLISDGRRAA